MIPVLRNTAMVTLACACAAATPGHAPAQAGPALVTHVRGAVKVLRGDARREIPARVGLRVAERDSVDVARGSRVVLLFADGHLLTATTPLVIAPAGGAEEASAFARAQRAIAAATRTGAPQGKGMTGRPPPGGAYPLAPGHGSAVAESRPVFRWRPQEGAESYRIQIRAVAGGAAQRFRVIGSGPWALPDTVAALERGAEYAWTVVPLPDGRAGPEERFRVLDGAALAELEAFLESLSASGVAPDGEGLFLVAAISAELGLLHDALAALEKLVATTPAAERDPVVDLLYARTLERLGRAGPTSSGPPPPAP